MGLTSHLSDAYDTFSSYFVSYYLILSLMKMSLMKSLIMMVMGPGSPPVCAFLNFLNYPLIVLVDCHVMELLNPFVVSVENIFRFPLKTFSSFQFRILNMITVFCRFAHSFKIMCIPQPVCFEVVPTRTGQIFISGRGGEGNVWFNCCIEGQEPEIYELWTFSDGICKVHPYARVKISNDFIGETFHTHFFNE